MMQVESKSRERRKADMMCVSVKIREEALRQVRITAPSIEWALKIAGAGKPERRIRIVFPIDSEAFFVPEGYSQRKAA
jgi:hypothetical protein